MRDLTIVVGPNAKGDWVGVYGHDGYALGAWTDNTSTGDLVVAAAGVSLSLVQGLRSSAGVQTPVRALEDWNETERRVGAWYHATQLKLRLDFAIGLRRHAPPLRARLVDHGAPGERTP